MVPLLGVVYALKGAKVTVELKNGVSMKGTVTRVDGMMNIHLKNAVVIFRNHKYQEYATVTVRGNNIAYIVPPDDFDSEEALKDVTLRTKKNDQPGPSGKGKSNKKKGRKEELQGVPGKKPDPSGQESGILNRGRGEGTRGRGGGMRGRGDSTPGRGDGMQGRGGGTPRRRDGAPGRGDGIRGRGDSTPGRGDGMRGRGDGTRGRGGGTRDRGGVDADQKSGMHGGDGGSPVQYTAQPRQS